MSQTHPLRNGDALVGPGLQGALGLDIRGLRPNERDNQIELGSASQHVADAAKHAVDFSEGAKPIEVHGWCVGCLPKQFLFVHESPVSFEWGHQNTNDKKATLNFRNPGTLRRIETVQPQIESILAIVPHSEPSRRTRPDRVRQRNHQRLDDIGQFGQRQREARHDRPGPVLAFDPHRSDDAIDDLHLADLIRENLLDVVRVYHCNHLPLQKDVVQ